MNIVVTGSSTGIGRALAERLLSCEHQVWGLARSDQRDFAAQHEGRFHFSRCDVSNWRGVEQAVRKVAQAWSHVDDLASACPQNAGFQREVRLESEKMRRWTNEKSNAEAG